MKFKLVPQRIVQLMSLVVTQVTTEFEDFAEIYLDGKNISNILEGSSFPHR